MLTLSPNINHSIVLINLYDEIGFYDKMLSNKENDENENTENEKNENENDTRPGSLLHRNTV